MANEEINFIPETYYKVHERDPNYKEIFDQAEKYKQDGNMFLQQNKLMEAFNSYTNAIDLKVETVNNSIYLTNRAIVNLKMENYGSAIIDANLSIKINKDYFKAFYRRASAYFYLGKLDEALKDFNYLKSKNISDPSLDERIKEVKNAKKKKAFFLAFSSEGRGKQTYDIKSLLEKTELNSNYKTKEYPSNNEITLDWIKSVIEDMKDLPNKKSRYEKYLDKRSMLRMLLKVKEIFTNQKEALVDIVVPDDIEFTVVGDLHGQFYDLLHIFEINGYPSEKNPYIFNGDLVDRGVFSVEILTTLFAFKVLYPNHMFIARGNHESSQLNNMYGFKKESIDKYDDTIYDCFSEVFNTLPLAHCLNNKILILHGGLFSKDGVTLDDLRKIDRFREIPESGLMNEMLWTDPCRENGRHPSKRGVGVSFGPDVTNKFLEENKLKYLIRSHEVKMEGYEKEPNCNLITIFSAPNYCDSMNNKGAIIKIKGSEMEPKYIQFNASPHPDINIRKYMSLYY